LRAQTGRTVIGTTMLQRQCMEGIDGIAAAGAEADMQAGFRIGRHRAAGLIDPELRPRRAPGDAMLAIVKPLVAERRQCGIVEGGGAFGVAYADGNMVEQLNLPL